MGLMFELMAAQGTKRKHQADLPGFTLEQAVCVWDCLAELFLEVGCCAGKMRSWACKRGQGPAECVFCPNLGCLE